MVTEREERAQFFVRLCTIYNRNDNLKKNYIEIDIITSYVLHKNESCKNNIYFSTLHLQLCLIFIGKRALS